MAEKLDSYDFAAVRSGRPDRYPWAEWFDGSIWRLEQGEDFHSIPENFRQSVRQKARAMEVEVEVVVEKPKHVVLQAKR